MTWPNPLTFQMRKLQAFWESAIFFNKSKSQASQVCSGRRALIQEMTAGPLFGSHSSSSPTMISSVSSLRNFLLSTSCSYCYCPLVWARGHSSHPQLLPTLDLPFNFQKTAKTIKPDFLKTWSHFLKDRDKIIWIIWFTKYGMLSLTGKICSIVITVSLA